MKTNFDIMALTLLFPLLGALLVGLAGKRWGKTASAFIASGSVALSFFVVLATIFGIHSDVLAPTRSVNLWHWATLQLNNGDIDVGFGLYIDPLSLTLMSVITGVGFLIHWFSSEYMEHDPDATRYFCLLNLFIAAMTLLVLANNFITLIIGWGGVGFASFSLIGFWRQKPSAGAAAKKAFVMNVIGDIGLMLAVFILVKEVGVVDYQTMFAQLIPQLRVDPSSKGWLQLAVFGILLGAYAKSAQLPLHTWLPDAMEGPTPVSALIHAATMVTAGVYLLVRCHPLLELTPGAMPVIATLGALTALYAACCALVQNDLKRVLAYSTMSQLGYMFLAIGVGAYGPAIFHLVTHAFFKALLFLTAGIVIHAAHGEQDMRRLGGLSKDIPFTCFMFGVGGAALAGVPVLSGYFSKEAILHSVHNSNGGTLLFLVGAGVAILTAFYTGRAFFMTFYGPQRVDHPHLPGGPTTLSCTILTILAVVAGFFDQRLSKCFDKSQTVQGWLIKPEVTSPSAITLTILVLLAIGTAYAMYGRGQHDKLGRNSTFLNFARNGFGFDAAYDTLAGGFTLISRLASRGLDKLFTESIPDLLGRSFVTMGTALKETQTGQIRHYMISVMISVVVVLLYSMFIGGSL
jgi:NADH-quinone oxidoreductase subunit L